MPAAQGQARATASKRVKGPNVGKMKKAAENLSRRRLTADRVDDGVIVDMYTLHHQRLIMEYERARESRMLLSGDWQVPLPPEYDDDDRAAYGGTSSDWWMLPLQTAQRLGSKRCRIMRPEKPGGLSRAAKRNSTGIEVFVNGLMDALFPWPEWVENLQNEGCSAIKIIPAPAHYERVPTLYDDDETVSPEEYDELPEERRAEYEPSEGYKRVKARYRVNEDGDTEPAGGSSGWKFDRKESTTYYEEERDQHLGDNPPLVIELLSRLDFVPVNPRFSGKGVEIDGIVSRRLFSRDSLRAKGYWWKGCEADGLSDAMDPIGGEESGRDGDLYLYEYIGKDGKGQVFIAYQVAGAMTRKGDPGNGAADSDTAVFNLTKLYGMRRVPVVFRYGSHWGTSDPTRRSITFIQPFAGDMKRRDIVATATTISMMWDAMPSYGQRITPDGSPAAALNGSVDLNVTVRPNSVVPLYGELVRLGGQGAGKDAPAMMAYFDEQANRHAPQPGTMGGDGPSSGIDRQTQGADFEKAHAHVLEGARSGYEEVASLALEICTGLGNIPEKPPVSINVLSTVPAAQPGNTTTQQRLTLNPKACGDNFTVIAEYPHQPGENLAAAAQWQAFAMPGVELILREEFRALAMGDPSPEIYEAKRILQRFLDTPEGMSYVMEQVMEELNDERLRAILKLQNEGRVTQGGQSVAAMGDIIPSMGGMPPMGGDPSMGGTPQGIVAPQAGNPGQSAYAGAVGGATAASSGVSSPMSGPPQLF